MKIVIGAIIKNGKIKNLLLTLAFYLCCFPAVGILDQIIPGDMCNPGLGTLFLLFILPLIILALILMNIVLINKGNKDHYYSLWMHLAVITSGFIYFIF
jgi:hypothetical protein